jgi:hypothetical protein
MTSKNFIKWLQNYDGSMFIKIQKFEIDGLYFNL